MNTVNKPNVGDLADGAAKALTNELADALPSFQWSDSMRENVEVILYQHIDAGITSVLDTMKRVLTEMQKESEE